ncbi:MAG: LLM class flavin-dependent oxidoreductase [Corynebacterium sp.]|nr:LLM class flavin-dependent oxidoreductase [Corynebacterium sp.]
MKRFGFLSFGHYSLKSEQTGKYGAQETLKQAVELGQIADDLGVNGAYFRVHHFAPQGASPIPVLSAIAATTKNIEVGTGVIDMRYENPLYLAEEVAQLDLLSDQRIAIGISRGSPEPAIRGWEAFDYGSPELAKDDPKGVKLAREKFEKFLAALRGEAMATAAPFDQQYPRMYHPGAELPVLPHSPNADRRIWWGATTHATAEQAARDGVNLMSSTLILETNGPSLGKVQADQIARYRAEWEKAGHDWEPRVSVSRSIFPIVDGTDAQIFGPAGSGESRDSLGIIDDQNAIFGRTLIDTPDKIIEALQADEAVMSADTLMLTIPNQAGVPLNTRILENFATHVAPALGWEPAGKASKR